MNATFAFIVLISIVLAVWTGYVFVSQSSKSSEIIKLIQDMYVSQKSVVIDVIDLSKILVKDTSQDIATEVVLPDLEDNSQLEESKIIEDNGDNPLRIVIEPSLPELSENALPEFVEEPLANEENGDSMNALEMEMEMYS